MQPLILLFLKLPEAGRVKTRLASAVGPDEAVRIYRSLVTEVLRRLPPEVAVRVCCDPPGRGPAFREWLGRSVGGAAEWVDQRGEHLGERLAGAFQAAFADGWGPVVAIGGDCPEIPTDGFREAVTVLQSGGTDLVLGPATDGGYYLIGLRRPGPALFSGIPWGGPGVYAATRLAAHQAGWSVHLLPERRDVDTLEDWRDYCARRAAGGSVEPGREAW